MAFNIETDILLPASPERVWQVLTDFQSYPSWNPFLTQASGDWAVGNTVAVTAGGMSFKPTILAFNPGQELRWLGSLLFKGVFDGEHYFQLHPAPDGKTRLVHGENFSGLLVPLFKSKLNTNTKDGFKAMNEALRDRLS